MTYLSLIIAGLSETLFVYSLKKSNNFKNKLWACLTILCGTASFFLLSYAMRFLDTGIAYSIWVAIGSVGTVLMSYLLFKEKLSKQQFLGIILIIISIIGLKLS